MNKKGIEMETLAYWIIAIVILAVIVMGYLILKSKDISAITYIKNLFRFGG
ncbi:MAG: hypothetical protein Q7S33_05890 [Nanoarchaeota archaeon]|nr:hypothetical protein [Nanoarchaeota archaeon]